MKPPANYPGIGGSLGQCAVCGDTFLLEIILNQKVQTIEVDGIDRSLPVHKKCRKLLRNGMDWHDLPPGPLRSAFEKASK